MSADITNTPPRRQSSRSAPDTNKTNDNKKIVAHSQASRRKSLPEEQQDPGKNIMNPSHPVPRDPSDFMDQLIGPNPVLADMFFGQPMNMARPLPPAPDEKSSAGEEKGSTPVGSAVPPPPGVMGPPFPGSATQLPKSAVARPQPQVATRSRRPDLTGEHPRTDFVTSPGPGIVRGAPQTTVMRSNAPVNVDDLILRQLKADHDSYVVDLDFCKAQLSLPNITAAEMRTFQLRVLDLGHQMRMCNHRIQLMEFVLYNSPVPGPSGPSGPSGRPHASAAATANLCYGNYPPGTMAPGYLDPNHAQSVVGSMQPFPSPVDTFHPGPFALDPSRKKPKLGRPLGAKNHVNTSTPPQPSDLPPAGAQGAPSSEIRVAAPDPLDAKTPLATKRKGRPPAEASGSKPDKRRKSGNETEMLEDGQQELAGDDGRSTQNEIKAVSSATQPMDPQYDGQLQEEDVSSVDDDGSNHADASHLANSSAAGRSRSRPHDAIDSASPGHTYQRLGYWRCRLCTSQKYLNAPLPKQPIEPGTWPLRDVSKMVVHFTRMHGEHNDVERCMELGAALRDNHGPFFHWLIQTKKERLGATEVEAAVEELENGRMPQLLRRVSKSAADFAVKH